MYYNNLHKSLRFEILKFNKWLVGQKKLALPINTKSVFQREASY